MRERVASRVQALAQRLDRPGYPWYVHVLDALTGAIRTGSLRTALVPMPSMLLVRKKWRAW
jgi:hypothetical protein